MKTKHTKGPWRAERVQARYVIRGANNEYIGSVDYGVGKPTMEANARLIAAAPELVAALEGLLAGAKPLPGVQPGSEAFMTYGIKGALLEAARAALAGRGVEGGGECA